MADIFHNFLINAQKSAVFQAISEPFHLDIWWSESSKGKPGLKEIYTFSFGPEYNWQAHVSKYVPNETFELTFVSADNDWVGTKVGFTLRHENNNTEVRFYHTGWERNNEHYKISCYCWAMYLRILKRYLEFGEKVPYKNRLNV